MATTKAENKELVREFVDEMFNEGNLDRLEAYVTEEYVEHAAVGQADFEGPDAVREYHAGIQTAFPDFEITIHDLVADGTKVALRSSQTGTHEGSFMDIDPTGETVESSGMAIYRIDDGQLAEKWALVDVLGVMQQLGAVEPPGE